MRWRGNWRNPRASSSSRARQSRNGALGTCLPAEGSYLEIAEAIGADLTVVGPEAPLVAGVVDEFRARGMRSSVRTGPPRNWKAARFSQSTFFCKGTSRPPVRHRRQRGRRPPGDSIVSAFRWCSKPTAWPPAKAWSSPRPRRSRSRLATFGPPGDRGIPARRRGQLHRAVRRQRRRAARAHPGSQSRLRWRTGPNTGGMGAYCDSAILTEAQTREVLDRVIHPTVEATASPAFCTPADDDRRGAKVLEFNVRMGDPETQPLMHRMESDFVPALVAAAEGDLAPQAGVAPGPSVCVVMASGLSGPIHGARHSRNRGRGSRCHVFHAGTRRGPVGLETAGGRVLGVTARARSAEAIDRAYPACGKFNSRGCNTAGTLAARASNGTIRSGHVAQMDRAVAS